TLNSECDELYTCCGGCFGPFITANDCRLVVLDQTDFLGYPGSSVGQVECTVSYGRNSARAKSCITETEIYSCEGGAVLGTYATCYNCAMPKQS
ncbi:hypothetical protein CROQUDRAFT_47038, partial [Cronartium quercuum f. sp. fusiforme G11]